MGYVGFQICDMGKYKLLFEFEEETNAERMIMGEPRSFDKNLVFMKRLSHD